MIGIKDKDVSTKASKKEKNVLYLGRDATSVEAGRPWKDAQAIRGIWHPEHSLHDRYDPSRYDVTRNAKFAALVEVTRAAGVPAPIAIRRNGTLRGGDPELVYLQRHYAGLRKDEPVVETVWGNSRLAALLLVNEERARIGEKPYRMPCLHKPMTNAAAGVAFSAENNIRQANSLYQNVIIVESRLAGGGSYEDLVLELGMPAAELRRVYEPLRGQLREVVAAFESGTISLSDVKKIGKLHEAGRLAALTDCIAKQGDWAPKTRRTRATLSVSDYRRIAEALGDTQTIKSLADREAARVAAAVIARLDGDAKALSEWPELAMLVNAAIVSNIVKGD